MGGLPTAAAELPTPPRPPEPRGPTGGRSCSLRLRSPQPVELPAPSLVGAAVVAAHRRQRRRLPRRLLLRPLPRSPAEPLAPLQPRAAARRLRVAVLARVLERLQHVHCTVLKYSIY